MLLCIGNLLEVLRSTQRHRDRLWCRPKNLRYVRQEQHLHCCCCNDCVNYGVLFISAVCSFSKFVAVSSQCLPNASIFICFL